MRFVSRSEVENYVPLKPGPSPKAEAEAKPKQAVKKGANE
jgi:hypothetical protein